MKNWKSYFKIGSQDLVISNPPFFKLCGKEEELNNLNQLSIARHELAINSDSFASVACSLLEDKEYFILVHRPDRFIEIIEPFKKYGFSLKRVQFCHTKLNKSAKIVLIEGVKN